VKKEEWVLLPRQATMDMLAEIQLDPAFTGRALQTRYEAMIRSAPPTPAWSLDQEQEA